jgi:hypothetical protein
MATFCSRNKSRIGSAISALTAITVAVRESHVAFLISHLVPFEPKSNKRESSGVWRSNGPQNPQRTAFEWMTNQKRLSLNERRCQRDGLRFTRTASSLCSQKYGRAPNCSTANKNMIYSKGVQTRSHYESLQSHNNRLLWTLQDHDSRHDKRRW